MIFYILGMISLAIAAFFAYIADIYGEEIPNKQCLHYSDGQLAILDRRCYDHEIIPMIKWFLSRGYSLDAVTDAEGYVMSDKVYMTR